MFEKGKLGSGPVAVVDIGSGSASVAIMSSASSLEIVAYAREELPLEKRSQDASQKGVLQALSVAGEKVAKEFSQKEPSKHIGHCYCVLGAPWSRSIAGEAVSRFEKETTVTDQMIADLAKQALTDQKQIERKDLLEANVARVLLNGYPTDMPAGKRAEDIHIFTLLSDCDPAFRSAVQETLLRFFPQVTITWRSSARATLAVAKLRESANSLVAVVGAEAMDLIVVRKGILTDRALVPLGTRQIATSFAAGKPVEETIGLLEMLEKEQCETDACKALEESIARAEPELAQMVGETFAKLSGSRKLPDEMVVIAPPELSAWLSRFYARIDFTQFVVSARPFSVSSLPLREFSDLPQKDPKLVADPGLMVACALVNIETNS